MPHVPSSSRPTLILSLSTSDRRNTEKFEEKPVLLLPSLPFPFFPLFPSSHAWIFFFLLSFVFLSFLFFLPFFFFSPFLLSSTELIFPWCDPKRGNFLSISFSSHFPIPLTFMIHFPCAMCHMDTCTRWKMPHHMALMPCALLKGCYVAPLHVSSDTRASKYVKFQLS